MKKYWIYTACIFIVAILAPAFSDSSIESAYANSLQSSGLFIEAEIAGDTGIAPDPTVIRTRLVHVDFNLLVEPDGMLSETANALPLNLFDDVFFIAIRDHMSLNLSGSSIWLGHIDGIENSQVTLVMKDGIMVGNISIPEAFYQVRYSASSVHIINEIDQSAFPSEADPISIDIPGKHWLHDIPLSDDGTIIDLLVVYTADARAAAGGTTAMNNLIDLAVSETNTSYFNSGIAQRLNLVYASEVTYVETGDMYTDLPRLQNPSDGYMDNVHSLRDAYCADEVALIIANGGSYCGLAYMMSSVSSAFESWSFAVIDDGCATGYYSLAHELGHNMGARHDWYVDSTSYSPYSYNHGYVNSANSWRTVMAYNNECSDSGAYCTRIPYWSNPDVTYGGNPTGIPAGTSTACITGIPNPNCDADNRTTLNNTAYTVANFRQSCTANAYMLWGHPASGSAHLWKLNASNGFDSAKGFAMGAGWYAISYHRNADGTGCLLWANPSTGQAHLWILNASNQIVSTKGFAMGAGWWVTSYHRNSDGSGYLLWTLPGNGWAHLWSLNAGNQIASAKGFAMGTGWWATSYHRNADGTSQLLWTHPSDGLAHLWSLNAGYQITSTKGYSMGNDWWATSYHHNADNTSQLLWTHPGKGWGHLWTLNSSMGLTGTKGFAMGTGWWAQGYHGFSSSGGDILQAIGVGRKD